MQKGKWNGKQLIARKWVEEATSKQTSNEGEDHATIGADWREGYGFQFWRCRHNAFRADGAGGQFIVVLPDQDVVVAITADTGNMQGELDAIWDHLLPAFQSSRWPQMLSVSRAARSGCKPGSSSKKQREMTKTPPSTHLALGASCNMRQQSENCTLAVKAASQRWRLWHPFGFAQGRL